LKATRESIISLFQSKKPATSNGNESTYDMAAVAIDRDKVSKRFKYSFEGGN